ncbi:MAG: SdpI family protein [Rhodothermales bacterium]|nr:SdpI family protein [Rhodothermales bacterium]
MITSPANLILGGTLVFIATVFLLLAIPLIRRRVKVNYLYGIRFKKSYSSDEAWYDINEYGGKVLAISSVPMFILGLLCFFVDLEANQTITLIIAFSPAVVAVACALYIWRYTAAYITDSQH